MGKFSSGQFSYVRLYASLHVGVSDI